MHCLKFKIDDTILFCQARITTLEFQIKLHTTQTILQQMKKVRKTSEVCNEVLKNERKCCTRFDWTPSKILGYSEQVRHESSVIEPRMIIMTAFIQTTRSEGY